MVLAWTRILLGLFLARTMFLHSAQLMPELPLTSEYLLNIWKQNKRDFIGLTNFTSAYFEHKNFFR